MKRDHDPLDPRRVDALLKLNNGVVSLLSALPSKAHLRAPIEQLLFSQFSTSAEIQLVVDASVGLHLAR